MSQRLRWCDIEQDKQKKPSPDTGKKGINFARDGNRAPVLHDFDRKNLQAVRLPGWEEHPFGRSVSVLPSLPLCHCSMSCRCFPVPIEWTDPTGSRTRDAIYKAIYAKALPLIGSDLSDYEEATRRVWKGRIYFAPSS